MTKAQVRQKTLRKMTEGTPRAGRCRLNGAEGTTPACNAEPPSDLMKTKNREKIPANKHPLSQRCMVNPIIVIGLTYPLETASPRPCQQALSKSDKTRSEYKQGYWPGGVLAALRPQSMSCLALMQQGGRRATCV